MVTLLPPRFLICIFIAACIAANAFTLTVSGQIGFTAIPLAEYQALNPTSLQFGPDGRLYVSNQGGYLEVLTISRVGPGDYEVVDKETITLVREIPNHNDDGTPHGVVARQVTGILVTGTASQPVIYVTSSDYRIGGASGAHITNLDTNSGVLSRLTLDQPGGMWTKVDLVRGLPRSQENHASNGLQLDPNSNTLYLAQGGNTNAGSPSNNFAFLGETALSAAILSIDLDAIEAMPIQGIGTGHPWVYDLPTVGEPPKPGTPFGGLQGLNQARLVPDGPVQIYAPGFRNAYALVITEAGRMYAVDNGANQGWGGTPHWEDPDDPGTVTNFYNPDEPGSTSNDVNGQRVTNVDYLHHITGPGYYAGHPTPIRANPEGAGWFTYNPGTGTGVWRTSTDPSDPNPLPPNWPPVPPEMANPIEGDFQSANNPKGLWGWPASTNGIAEYSATNFDGAMTGNLLTVVFNTGNLFRIELSEDGTTALDATVLASGFGSMPLDVTAQGDFDPFPGTIWVAVYGSNLIVPLEPTDYDGASGVPCSGANDPWLDESGNCYSNADMIANGLDPCNPAVTPPDFSGNCISDLLDPDDDGDGIPDTHDPFQRDFHNGARKHLPVVHEMLNSVPGYGYAGVGFTGWMIDYETDYLDMYDEDRLIVGGAAGLFTISDVDQGDAWLDQNDQMNAFQFGLNVDAQSGLFYIVTRLMPQGLFKPEPQDYQSAGLYIGNGDQDNYLRISAAANGGQGGIEVLYEVAGEEVFHEMVAVPEVLSASQHIELYLSIDPATGFVVPSYSIDGAPAELTTPLMVQQPILGLLRRAPDSSWSNALAIGIIGTSNPRELGTPLEQTQFTATWDFIYAQNYNEPIEHEWEMVETTNTCHARHENGLTAIDHHLVLMGGRGIKPVEHLDLATHTWTQGSPPPLQMHHFQPVAYEGLIYVIGALTGHFPDEPPVDRIYIYDPVTSVWHEGPMIPEERRRGSAGAALYNGKIYIAGGSTLGHGQGVETTVGWTDVYNPVTNRWRTLPDAPNPRDHTQLVEAGGMLYLVGGRIGGTPGDFFSATVPQVDVFDPVAETWSSLPTEENLPTPRGGVMAGRLGPRVVVAGGESGQPDAHHEVEAYHIHEQTWETLPSLVVARHGTGMAGVGDALYVVAGSGSRGGSPELDSVEIFTDTSDPVDPMDTVVPGILAFEPGSVSFGSVSHGSSSTKTVRLMNTGGNQGTVITEVSVAGSDFTLGQPSITHRVAPNEDEVFDVLFPFVLAPYHEIDIPITFNASGSGTKEATLNVTYSDGFTLALPVEGSAAGGPAPVTEVRINAGGSQYTDSQGAVWSSDTHFTGGNAFNAGAIEIAGTDDPTLYRTERWGGSSFSYHIPVETGTYDVHLHFAEIYWGVHTGVGQNHTGRRVFSVFLEGEEVLLNYDIWADVGSATASVQSIPGVEVNDGILNITVSVSADSATFAAIEVLPAGEPPPPADPFLTADPAFLEFGSIETGSNALETISLGNTGGSSLTIGSTSISGPNASDFSIETLAGTSIDPGESVPVEIAFAPSTAGTKEATLEIIHDGENSPFAILLTGAADPTDPGEPSEALRINAGGPAYTDAAGNVWSGDVHFSGGNTYNAGGIEIANTSDPVLYRTERWGDSFTYNIPLEPGLYEVRLHFAEIFWGVASGVGANHTGRRVFSVALNGVAVLSDYDIWADVGPAVAVIHGFNDVAVDDGVLRITVGVSANSAKFSAIEVLSAGEPADEVHGVLTANPTALNFGSVDIGSNSVGTVTLANTGEAPLTLQNGTLSGTGAASFSFGSFASSELAPGESLPVEITFAPDGEGSRSATLAVDHTGSNSPISISLTGTGVDETTPPPEPVAAARINAGGPAYTDAAGKAWSGDAHFSGGSTYNAGGIEIANTSDPALYRTERWGDSFTYNIPLESGTYDVRLHFAEIFWGVASGVGANHTGRRVFSVALDGGTVLTAYDIWADVGPAAAVVHTFESIEVTGGTLVITVEASANNAKFSAIEVLSAGEPADEDFGVLTANPAALDFGSVDIGSNSVGTVTLANTGDAPLTLQNGTLSGTGAASFSFVPFANSELAPGESLPVEITFAPDGEGSHSATLAVDHTGSNSPISISLTGTGVDETTPPPEPVAAVRINAGGPAYTDSQGQAWSADAHFAGGSTYNAGGIEIANTSDPALYRTERWGDSLTYNIPLESGTYDVRLHFAEIFWGVASGVGANHTGRRVFSVALDGGTVLTAYDIWADVGPAAAVVHTFESIEVTGGTLVITVEVSANNAKFSGIEVVPVEK